MNKNLMLGARGERIACLYLKRNGYRILETNYRCKVGEIDIIAEDKDILVFVEVKTRSGVKYGLPQYAVTVRKKKKLRKTAEYYLLKQHIDMHSCLLRFDCIAIILNGEQKEPGYFSHIKNIFL